MSPGKQLDSSALARLHEGQTQDEVREIFGKPKQTITGEGGAKLDEFQVLFPKNPHGMTQSVEVRSLHVLYDGRDRVKKFVSYVGQLNGYFLPTRRWVAGHPLSPDSVNHIERRLTTRSELTAALGPAAVEGLDVLGNPTASWFYVEGSGANLRQRRELLVVFDARFVVQNFALRELQD